MKLAPHKPKPCTLGPKHKWEFVKNFSSTKSVFNGRGSFATMTLRGYYKCLCGQDRIGQANSNGPDLRELMAQEKAA